MLASDCCLGRSPRKSIFQGTLYFFFNMLSRVPNYDSEYESCENRKRTRDMDQSIYTKLSKFIKLPLHIQFEKKYTSSYSS